MKKYVYIIVAALFVSIGCKDTNENMVQDRGTYFVPKMTNINPAVFLPELEDSYVSFNLSLGQGEQLDKIELEVARGNARALTERAILREVALSPGQNVDITITAAEFITALGIPESDYNLGDNYYLYVLTTQNGKIYRSGTRISLPVLCPFETEMLVGRFYFIDEDGEDGYVTIEADPKDPYKVYIKGMAEAQGLTGNGNPIELNVNPSNYSVTGPKTIIAANVLEWGFPYTNLAFEPIGNNNNFNACDNSYTIVFELTVNAGSWGGIEFVFTKEE